MATTDTRADWAAEEGYWRENFRHRPYFEPGQNFDFFAPAYRFGYEASERYRGRKWNDVEFDLRRDWDRYKERGKSTWEQIKGAVKDAWERVAS